MLTLRTLIVALTVLLLTAPGAMAQHAHGEHDEGPNGGQIIAVGPFDAEVLFNDDLMRFELRLFEHEGADLTDQATSAEIIYVAGGKPTKISLARDGGALVAKLDDEPPHEIDAVVRVKTTDGKVHAGKGEIEFEH